MCPMLNLSILAVSRAVGDGPASRDRGLGIETLLRLVVEKDARGDSVCPGVRRHLQLAIDGSDKRSALIRPGRRQGRRLAAMVG